MALPAEVGPQETPKKRIRAVVVDDSAVMRRVITRILETDPEIEVIATACDGAEAVELARTLRPDVLTLDVNMPRMDGLRALEMIMGRHPIPVVLLSAFARPGGHVVEQAMSIGAVFVVQKPSEFGICLNLDILADELRSKVRSAARVRVVRNASFGIDPARQMLPVTRRITAVPAPAAVADGLPVIAIGASTGGTEVLAEMIPALPADFGACVLIVQHMPLGYTSSWAKTLNGIARLCVLEARHGDFLRPGKVFVAPGGHHMEVQGEYVRLTAGPPVKMHRPSVDVLFDSLRPIAHRVCAVVLTGMGDDGVAGMMRLHAAGARTFAQDQSSSVVWGMPGAAVRAGCVDHVLKPSEIVAALRKAVEQWTMNGQAKATTP